MIWLMLLGMLLITFYNRYAFFTRSLAYSPGPKVRRFLSYSSYAVLTAIWTPVVFQFNQPLSFSSQGLDYLLAASVAAILSFLRTPSIAVVLLSTVLFFAIRFI